MIIKTAFDQLPDEVKIELVTTYMDEEKADLIEMYLHEKSPTELVEILNHIKNQEELSVHYPNITNLVLG